AKFGSHSFCGLLPSNILWRNARASIRSLSSRLPAYGGASHSCVMEGPARLVVLSFVFS
ncbi:unnamed protein product, partial [Chrysoparadoxa australica]